MPNNQSSAIVQRLWNYCTVLRDDGLSNGDYVEQLTYLLFLKMAHERELIGEISNLLHIAFRRVLVYDSFISPQPIRGLGARPYLVRPLLFN